MGWRDSERFNDFLAKLTAKQEDKTLITNPDVIDLIKEAHNAGYYRGFQAAKDYDPIWDADVIFQPPKLGCRCSMSTLKTIMDQQQPGEVARIKLKDLTTAESYAVIDPIITRMESEIYDLYEKKFREMKDYMESEIYDLYEKKFREMKDYMLNKVDEFLHYKTPEIEQAIFEKMKDEKYRSMRYRSIDDEWMTGLREEIKEQAKVEIDNQLNDFKENKS